MATPVGQNDSIITLGLDLVEETEQNAAIIVDGVTKSAAAEPPGQPVPPGPEQNAELQQAREAAEEARKREAEQEQTRERDGMER